MTEYARSRPLTTVLTARRPRPFHRVSTRARGASAGRSRRRTPSAPCCRRLPRGRLLALCLERRPLRGVGKTAVTDYLLDVLQEDATEYDDIDLSVLSVNCKTLNSSYQVAIELVNTLRPDGAEISTTGYPQQTVFKKLYSELEALGGTVVIVLDEIDSIGDRGRSSPLRTSTSAFGSTAQQPRFENSPNCFAAIEPTPSLTTRPIAAGC